MSTKKSTKRRPKKPSPKEKFQLAGREHALATYQARQAARMNDALVAYDDSTDESAQEARDEWAQLKRIAAIVFPEGSDYYGLTAKNRCVAIAHCLGWSAPKIAKAASVTPRTIYAWLKRDDVKLFIHDFNVKRGETSPDRLRRENAAKGFLVLKEILHDKDDSVAMKRLKAQVAETAIEREFGKPVQPVEHKGEVLREFFTKLNNVDLGQLSEEDERNLFNTRTAKTTKAVH